MLSGRQPDEVQGNNEAQNVLTIEYCGGWGYRKYAVELVSKIETNVGAGQFKYEFYADPGVTGRLEVTLFTPARPEGALLHSKAQSKAYVHADYPSFYAALDEALTKWVHDPLQASWFKWLKSESLSDFPEPFWTLQDRDTTLWCQALKPYGGCLDRFVNLDPCKVWLLANSIQ